MKAKIIITTRSETYSGIRRSEIWSGEMEILDDKEYLLRFAIIAEGTWHPICDVPFAIGLGHWLWIPPDNSPDSEEGWWLESAGDTNSSE